MPPARPWACRDPTQSPARGLPRKTRSWSGEWRAAARCQPEDLRPGRRNPPFGPELQLDHVQPMRFSIREARKQDKHALSLADCQPGVVVLTWLGDERGKHCRTHLGELRRQLLFDEPEEVTGSVCVKRADGCRDEALATAADPVVPPIDLESRPGPRRPQQEDVLVVEQDIVHRRAVPGPDLASVEGFERQLACRHVAEATQPDEAIGGIQVAELPDDPGAGGFLRLHQVALEDVDQDISLTGLQGVLTELDHRTIRRLPHEWSCCAGHLATECPTWTGLE